VNYSKAVKIQNHLRDNIIKTGKVILKDGVYVAGTDVSYNRFAKGIGFAAIVVCSYPDLKIISIGKAKGIIDFPYIPGLLSFREVPLLLKAWESLSIKPDVLLCDGQGIAHPRRCGLASHFGFLIDIPTIGTAKSKLIGYFTEPKNTKGEYSSLIDKNDIIGAALRTKANTKPVFVSIGNKIDLDSAISIVLATCTKYRLPDVIRHAHTEVNKMRLLSQFD